MPATGPAQEFQFAAVRDHSVVVPAIDDDAIPTPVRDPGVAFPAHDVDAPTTAGGEFLPVAVADAVLPTIGGAASLVPVRLDGEKDFVDESGRFEAASAEDLCLDERIFPANVVPDEDVLAESECQDAGAPGFLGDGGEDLRARQLRPDKHCRRTVAGRLRRSKRFFAV